MEARAGPVAVWLSRVAGSTVFSLTMVAKGIGELGKAISFEMPCVDPTGALAVALQDGDQDEDMTVHPSSGRLLS